MSEDQDGKTEEATERKLLDAKERGDVPYSREATLLAALAAMLISLIYLMPPGVRHLGESLENLIDNLAAGRLTTQQDLFLLLFPILGAMTKFLIPVFAVTSTLGLAAAFAQNGVQLASSRIIPDFSRISPRRGFSRIFGVRGWIEFWKIIAKCLTVTSFTAGVLVVHEGELTSAMLFEPSSIGERTAALATRLIAGAIVAMLVIVCADLVWVRIRWLRDQRMTRQELKEDIRQSEGDRLFKARLRSLRHQRLRKRMLNAVPRATMVIANPTHYAVALRYVRGEGGAPIVLAKGMNLIALKIRELAEGQGIPVIEDRALARSLYESTIVDQPIPPQFYRAIAELVHLIQERKNSWFAARGRTAS